ncbi:hypothetical protein BD311DRAFT_759000 [Dichomitus squalens]|uniref:Uncharacterized protein n=1 Tax=Dichomitus squalens TaxID=114155 RepID=A0A4Q9MKY7_9APHY|nr:hypothetical protein BD311DRAFT_759000 [Dichomitus squalens]
MSLNSSPLYTISACFVCTAINVRILFFVPCQLYADLSSGMPPITWSSDHVSVGSMPSFPRTMVNTSRMAILDWDNDVVRVGFGEADKSLTFTEGLFISDIIVDDICIRTLRA